MRKNGKVAAVAFGINEFGLSIIFSMTIWIKLLHGLDIQNVILFGSFCLALLATIWQVFNREKAKSYLIAFACRMFYLSSVFAISQMGGLFDDDEYKIVWLVLTILLFALGMMIHFKMERKYWKNTLEDWEKAGKIIISQKFFRIYGAFHSQLPTLENYKRIYTIIPVGTIILTIVMGILGDNIKLAFVHLILMSLGYFCVFMLGRIIAWIIEIRQLEAELGVTFVTEFGMPEEKEKGKLRKRR